MKGRGLGDARRLYRARKFPEVIRILEPEVFRYRESFEYFTLLGFSCLHTGDVGGAQSYIGRARQLKKDDVSVMLGLAAIHLRRGENESAVKCWLEVLEEQHANPTARRGLELLRKGLTPEKLQESIDSGRFRQLLPPLQPRLSLTLMLVFVLGALALAGLGYLGYRVSRPSEGERPGVSAIEIPPDLPRLVEAVSGSRYQLTEREVKQVFSRAKSDLFAYRDNLAAVEVNRILLSNATVAVKERAQLLKDFVEEPSFTTLRDSFPYKTVAAEPALYDGCSVSWKGKIANLLIGKESIDFDLLVGYEQEKELAGTVHVTLGFNAQLENGDPLELLARILIREGRIALKGISLHRLASP